MGFLPEPFTASQLTRRDLVCHFPGNRLKTLCSMKRGDGITSMSIEPSGEYPVYGGNGIRGYAAEFTHDGDFVLIGRQGALCGNVHIARGRFWASEHAVVASLRIEHSLEWFALILEVMDLNQYSIAAAQPGLAVERVLYLWMPVPPRREQDAIAADIADSTAEIEITIARAGREIELLNDYRIRLVADDQPADVLDTDGDLDESEASVGWAKRSVPIVDVRQLCWAWAWGYAPRPMGTLCFARPTEDMV